MSRKITGCFSDFKSASVGTSYDAVRLQSLKDNISEKKKRLSNEPFVPVNPGKAKAYWDKSFAYEYSDYAAAKKREAEENRINQERMRANSAAPFCSISPRKETFQPFPPWTGGLVSSKMQHASYGHSLSASRSSTPGLMSSKRRMKRGELSRPQSGFH